MGADMLSIRDLTAVPFAVFIGLPTMYLAFLAVVTLRRRSALPRDDAPGGALRFAVLIPAHDEEILVGRTVTSALSLDYPPDHFTVHVVADNCADATAAIARRSGACVHERDEPDKRGKGAALNWLIRRVLDEAPDVDAFVVVDSDSDLSTNLLIAMERRLRRGAVAVQALNLVAVSPDQPLSRIRDLAMRLHNHLRPLAHTLLGASSCLYGNGMCFAAAFARHHQWSETSVGEDGEFFARLVEDGYRVELAEEATVRSVMPASFRDARSQSLRWERGRFDHFHLYAGLAWKGVVRRDRAAFLAGVGVVILPISALAAGTALALVLAAVLRSGALAAVGIGSFLCLLVYVLRGAALGGMTARSLLRIMLWAVPYTAWMLCVLALAAFGVRRGEWVRTPRVRNS